MISSDLIYHDAVQNIEKFVKNCNPQKKQDVKLITKKLSTIAISAMISVHDSSEIIKYLESIKDIYDQKFLDN